MSLTWKDAVATAGAILSAGIVVALLSGIGETIDGRWMYGSALLFAVAGITALITGTASLLKRVWTSVTTYTLALAVVLITGVNIFLNSQAWFVALAIAVGLMWLEFVVVHLFSTTQTVSHTSTGSGAAV